MKRATVEPGSIRVCGIARGVSYPSENDGYRNIPAWSRGASPYNQLSPFFIGPVIHGEERAENFENFWQSHKVWPVILATKEQHVENGEPNAQWKVWHDKLMRNKTAVRRPNGRAIPLYAWWEGEKLGVVEARKRIYIPYLQELYRKHPVYQQLLEMVRGGQNICIIEPDGPDPSYYCEGVDMNLEKLIEWQDRTLLSELSGRYFPYGHGYVIALTLLEDIQRV